MHFDWLVPALLALLVVITFWIALRRPPVDSSVERQARELRDEVVRSAQGTRQELGGTLAEFQRTLLAQQDDTARTQNEQIDSFSRQLVAMQQHLADSLARTSATQVEQARLAREALDTTHGAQGARQAASLKELAESLGEQLRALVAANDQRMGEVKATVETRLSAIQADNEKKLEQIRATVDEKLHATLEQRLGESFRQVAERLEQVHRGIGEMQKLASDVGSLSRVLSNVKTRGIFGEVQLARLARAGLHARPVRDQRRDDAGHRTRASSSRSSCPGRRDDGAPLWLPIDCKFPRDDYERLVEAQERGRRGRRRAAARAIERACAWRRGRSARSTSRRRTPPTSRILFLPTEGLYAEALRRPGLVESAAARPQASCSPGPTTLLATLTSLQMGFRTLALEKRTSEVWETLAP